MKGPALTLLAICSAAALGGGLPRVAPPGPGMSPAPADKSPGGVDEKYMRRLHEGKPVDVPIRRPRGPSVLYPTPGGAVTDTGLPLSGQAGVLRDAQGGVWNCTAAGCFSPAGTFLPMKKTPPAAFPTE
jgi:hypothetical protein